MKLFHKFFLFCAVIAAFSAAFTLDIWADDAIYKVAETANGTVEVLEEFSDYNSAYAFYESNVDSYNNLVLYENDTVLKMEYGVVEFLRNDACTLDVGYRSNANNDGYLNGCYGTDAAYIGQEGNNVYFKISGDVGSTSLDDVILHPYQLMPVRPSAYSNVDGVFYHHIKRQLTSDFYSDDLALDNALNYLEDDKLYYSYDGHYFYDDFTKMSDDYKNGTYDNAVNSENPYYNYYQYLPLRSLTNYTESELEDYFNNDLGIIGKLNSYNDDNGDGANDIVNRSQYYGTINSFFTYQSIYGTNAMSLISISRNESFDGKSYAAFKNNNVYTNVAYQSDEERTNNKYSTIDDSIKAFAKNYLSNRYANYHTSYYDGLYLGNKESGINVRYTSDPYWGEKAASNYYLMDKTLGFKDYKTNAIGIIKDTENLKIYQDEELSDAYYTVNDISNYSILILAEKDNIYKVQIEPSFNSDYKYNFNELVGYIEKDSVDYLLNESAMHTNSLVLFNFDLDGGQINGEDNPEIYLLENSDPTFIVPTKDGYIFNGYQEKKDLLSGDVTYLATYKKIKNISLTNKFNTSVTLDGNIDLSGGEITVYYDSIRKDVIPLDSTMIFGFDSSNASKQDVTINYCGATTTVTINVSEDKKTLEENITDLINKNISSYKNDGSYSSTDIKNIKKNLAKINYNDTFTNIRLIDEMLENEYRSKTNYRINDDNRDASVSGLMLSLADQDITSFFKMIPDTYYVNMTSASNSNVKKVSGIAENYGFDVVDSFNLDFTLNMKNLELNGPIIVSIKLDDKLVNKIYTVYRVDDNGNIVKCETEHTTNYIQFKTDAAGDFIILEKNSINYYDFSDYKENVTNENSDPDSQGFFITGSIQLALMLVGIALIIVNNQYEKKRNEIWKDYKKSLQKVVTVQEEKLKN